MRTFLLPENIKAGKPVRITGKDFHYLFNVLRLKKGDFFKGTDGRGTVWQIEVLNTGLKEMLIDIRYPETPDKADVRISLYQSLLKGKKMGTVVRQAAEAGIHRIVPVTSAYTIMKVEGFKETQKRQQRWQRIAREALQQSGAYRLPVIEKPINLCDLLERKDGGIKLFFHQHRINDNTLHRCLAGTERDISILVGPEGGFADEEVKSLAEYGFSSIYLGSTVLRAETAALFALAAVRTIIQERKAWKLSE